MKSSVALFVKRGVLRGWLGVTLYRRLAQVHELFDSSHDHTFGMVYTSEPRGTEDAESGVDVVRKTVIFGPLS